MTPAFEPLSSNIKKAFHCPMPLRSQYGVAASMDSPGFSSSSAGLSSGGFAASIEPSSDRLFSAPSPMFGITGLSPSFSMSFSRLLRRRRLFRKPVKHVKDVVHQLRLVLWQHKESVHINQFAARAVKSWVENSIADESAIDLVQSIFDILDCFWNSNQADNTGMAIKTKLEELKREEHICNVIHKEFQSAEKNYFRAQYKRYDESIVRKLEHTRQLLRESSKAANEKYKLKSLIFLKDCLELSLESMSTQLAQKRQAVQDALSLVHRLDFASCSLTSSPSFFSQCQTQQPDAADPAFLPIPESSSSSAWISPSAPGGAAAPSASSTGVRPSCVATGQQRLVPLTSFDSAARHWASTSSYPTNGGPNPVEHTGDCFDCVAYSCHGYGKRLTTSPSLPTINQENANPKGSNTGTSRSKSYDFAKLLSIHKDNEQDCDYF